MDDLDNGGEPSAAESGATMVMSIAPPAEEEAPAAGDATMVFNTNTKPRPTAGPPCKLIVTRGPKAGSEFTLGPGESSLGRQNDNTIVIPDISVSRKHVVLRKEAGGYRLIDQGSGNGTLLNGEKVMEETILNDGDLFVMGDTEIKFSSPGAKAAAKPAGRPGARPPTRPPPGRPQPRAAFSDDEGVGEATGMMPAAGAPSRGKKKGGKGPLIAVAAISVIVLGLVGVKMSQAGARKADEQAQLDAQAGALTDAMNSGLEAAKKQIKEGDFKSAIASLEKAMEAQKKLVTDFGGAEDPQLKNKLEFAKKEISNQETFEKGHELVMKGQLTAAMAMLKKISEDSPVHDKVDAEIAAIKAKIPEKITLGRGALLNKEYDKAREAANDVLGVDAKNADAEALLKQIDDASGPKRGPYVAKATTNDGPKEDPTEKITAMFRAGKLDEAIGAAAACDDAACKAMADKLSGFREAYGNLDADGATEKATKLLKELSGGAKTPYDQAVLGRGAKTFLKEGVEKMSAEKYDKAFEAFRKVLSIDPSNALADKNLKLIHTKAKELFDQAYVDKGQDPEKATKEFQMVLGMTSNEDELHTKAKKHLKNLGGGE